jgi:hypothetical protein
MWFWVQAALSVAIFEILLSLYRRFLFDFVKHLAGGSHRQG